jgi:uncharacterized protein YbjT (DUF2867 family)
MKIVLTGSLGHIGKPLTRKLVALGHSVTVISSNAGRQTDIESMGANAAIGTMQDTAFLADTFRGANAVFLMEAIRPQSFFDPTFNIINTYTEIATSYKEAVVQSGVNNVIHLSSIGAHTAEGNGVLCMHHYAERILNELPSDVSIKFMRPVGFYTNLFRSLQTVTEQGAFISNYGGDKKEPWVSPLDIADAIAEEMQKPFIGRTVRYLASDEVSPNEIAKVLGDAIGKPDLKWLAISDGELLNRMLSAGMNPSIAKGFVEMQAAQGSGVLYEDYYRNKPRMGKIKLTHFAEDFAAVFRNQTKLA